MSGIKALDEGVVIDQCPAGHIDEHAARFHPAEEVGVDEVLGLGRGRRGEDYHVGESDHLVKLIRGDGSLSRITWRRVSTTPDHLRAKCSCSQRNFGPDRAEPDDRPGRARNLAPVVDSPVAPRRLVSPLPGALELVEH